MRIIKSFYSYAWSVAAIVIVTMLCALLYASVQFVMRSNADDPQVQMAEDAAHRLERGEEPLSIVGKENIDATKSLAPFLSIFDKEGMLRASSGLRDQSIGTPPAGVFEYAKIHKEHRLTWQPKSDLRIAIVLRHVDGSHEGFVLAGRSLREVELRIDRVTGLIFIGWLLSIGAIGGYVWFEKRKGIKMQIESD